MIHEGGLVNPGGGLAAVVEPRADDAGWLERLRAGDWEAFSTLVDHHQHAVVNYLTRLAGDRDRAEDLAQETFLRFYRGLAGYREEGQLQAYLFRIATNLVRSQERRQRRFRLLLPFLGGSRHAEPAAPGALLHEELHRQVGAAIAALPLRFRVPLVLHEIEGWPYEAIARELACREGTVKSRIFRGRKLLRQALEPYWMGGTPWKTSRSAS
jgi:RNA polymerase sigma-70 factor (ECF subfamily)